MPLLIAVLVKIPRVLVLVVLFVDRLSMFLLSVELTKRFILSAKDLVSQLSETVNLLLSASLMKSLTHLKVQDLTPSQYVKRTKSRGLQRVTDERSVAAQL